MADCDIRKRSDTIPGMLIPRTARYWYAVCPYCGKKIIPGPTSRHNSRKTVKDQRYHHIRKEHTGLG